MADRVLIVLATRESPDQLPEGLAEGRRGRRRQIVLQPFSADELRALAAGRAACDLTARAVHRLHVARRRQPALLARAARRAARRRLAPAGRPAPRRARSPRSSSAARPPARPTPPRLLEGVAILGPHGLLATAAELADVDEPLDALEEAVGRRACCASTSPAACPRPRSRTR